MKTRARATKNNVIPHGDENQISNEVPSPAPGKERMQGGFKKLSRRNGVSPRIRIDRNPPSSLNSSMTPSTSRFDMNRNSQRSVTEEQNHRMLLITTALSGWTDDADALFEIDTWKKLMKNAVAGNHLLERRYRADDRLTKLAMVVIEQITSIAFRNTVYQILVSNRGKKDKVEKAQRFLNLCDEYEKRKCNKTWSNAIGEDDDDPMNASNGDSTKSLENDGWITDEEKNYDGPLLNAAELGRLDSSCENGDEDMDVEKENELKDIRITRRGCNTLSYPLGTAKSHGNGQPRTGSNATPSQASRVFKDKECGSARFHLTRQCKVALNPLMSDDRLAAEINLGRVPGVDRLTFNEQRDIEKAGPIFSLGTDDEYIENETPPSTPLNGAVAEVIDQLGPTPSKRKKYNPKETKEHLSNDMDRARSEPVLQATDRSPARGYQVVGSADMIDRYNKFDYLSLAESSVGHNDKDGDDEDDLPDLNPPEHKDNKENFPKSEQDIASYYPKPAFAPELKPFMFELMQEALSKPRKDKIVSAFELTIKQEHLAVYNKSEWLEDVNIDFYLELIKDRNNKPGSVHPKVYIFHSFFYKLLEKNGYEAVRGGTGAEDIFEFDLVLIPIHSNHHWVLVAVNFTDKTMICYDSMDHNNTNQLKVIAKFLDQEYKENQRLRGDIDEPSESDEGPANIDSISISDESTGRLLDGWSIIDKGAGVIPQQTNGRDCGVFCLQFAEYLSRRMPFDFEQKHTAYFRKRMLYETLKKTLLIE